MGPSGKKKLSEEHSSGSKAKRRVSAGESLTAYDIALFCNLLGLAPVQLAQVREEITARYDLGPRGAWIIGLLEVGVNSPSALTEALRIGRSLVTAEINRLLQAKLIVGNQSERDARRTVLSLTEEGQQVSDALRALINAFVAERLARYSRREILACMAVLQDFVGGATIGTLQQ